MKLRYLHKSLEGCATLGAALKNASQINSNQKDGHKTQNKEQLVQFLATYLTGSKVR